MSDRTHIEVLSNRLKVRGVTEAGSGALSGVQLARSGFSGRPIGDRYSPTSRIGRGRLGEIYEAEDAAGRDVGVERRVALQRIDDRIVAEPRFIDELESGYALLRAGAHPNVVKVLDFFRDGKSYYLVMELLDGVSLRSVLDDAAPQALSLEETAPVIRAVGDGLQYLHAKSMVHGDLRAANVFITLDYVVKLLDVAPVSPLGGVPYRVEDAERGSRTRDVRDDVYDLACLTYELLSGRHPFNASSPHDAERAGLTAAPLHHLSVRQWEAIARGLALHRAQRTPGVAEYLREFGVSGTERLRAPTDRAAAPQSEAHVVPLHAVAPAPLTAPPAALGVQTPSRVPEPRRAAYAEREPRWPERRNTDGPVRGFALLVLLAGVGVLAFLGYDALRMGARQPAAEVGISTPSLPPAPVVQPAREAAAEATPEATRALESAEPAGPVAARTGATGSDEVEAAEPSPQIPAPVPAEPVEQRSAAAAVRDAPSPSSPAGRSEPASVSSGAPAFRFAQSVITVGEGQAAAAVVIERSAASAPATVVWWTSGDTAVADEDYADLGQRTERFAVGERSRTVYVPLVADSLPERTETFYVYLGQYDARRSHLQQVANVRVNIRDDD